MNYVVVGAGAIGTLVTQQLAGAGHTVTVVSRRGGGPQGAGVTRVRGDAADPTLLAGLAAGASAIFNCANPAYHRWPTDWPPMASSLLSTAHQSGATLVILSNLYVYGRVSGPMTPDTPLHGDYDKAQVRRRMWTDALDAHRAGRINVVEVRASDFIGPDAQGVFGLRVVPRLLVGKTCRVIGGLDQPHSWTYVDDVARTLITCAQLPTSWGRVWHAPTNPPRSQREVLDDLADVANVNHVRATVIPLSALRFLGLFSPTIRELPKTHYQFADPFVIDDTLTRAELGLEPTAWPEVLRSTVDAYRKTDRQ